MASFQTSQFIDSLTVKNIFTRGTNNSNIPAFRVLTTDGQGGTTWMTLSSLQYGGAFHTIQTTGAAYNATAASATLSILDGPNAGLLNDPTASNTAYLYAKAFGQFDISGGNSLYSYDPVSQKINSNVLFVGTGGINIRGDPQTNTMIFDGQELPYISSVPYAFNQFLVYSNAPNDTLVPSTFSSIKLQAKGPSSIISLLGEGLIVLNSDYANNRITFSISSLTNNNVSTLLAHDQIVFSTFINKDQFINFSTSFSQVAPVPLSVIQSAICTMSKSIENKIDNNSTILGDLSVYSKAISSFEYMYQSDKYIMSISSASNLQSTSANLQSSIHQIFDTINTVNPTIYGSTIKTPLFWTSTLVTLINSNSQPFITPDTSITPLNARYYATYPSYYNVFADNSQFGSPVKPSIYTTKLNVATGNATSNVSTLNGTIFSTMYALKGSFAFFPNNDPQNFQVSWRGSLSLTINGIEYIRPSLTYPRLETFSNNGIINGTINGAPICEASFTFLKVNATDFISFSNMTDLLQETESYSVAPIYSAYGYNTQDSPLYTSVIPMNLPMGFSTMRNLVASPYLELSSYVLIASTTYTSGCNTVFPITTSGYNSLSFYQSATMKRANVYTQNLSNGIGSAFTSSISASNAFGYNFNSDIPNSSYVFEIVFGRQNPYETFIISPLQKSIINYDYAFATYVSSFLYASSISSYNGNFVNINTINNNTLNINTSSISAYNASINNINTSSINTSSIVTSSINTKLIDTNILNASSINTLSINTSYISTSILNTSSINATVANISSLSSYNGSFKNLIVDTMYNSTFVSYNTNVTSLTVSSINNTVLTSFLFASTITNYVNTVNSTINVNLSTLNTSSVASTLASYINNVNSTINVNLSTLNTSSVASTLASYINSVNSTINVNLSTLNTSSVASTLASYINSVNSTINVNLSTINTSTVASTLASYLNNVNSTINYNLSTFSSVHTFIPGDNGSTVSTIYTNMLFLTSTLAGDISTYNTTWTPPGQTYTSTIYTSSVFYGGIRQPFIQYGYAAINVGNPTMLPIPYKDANYSIQLTYSNSTQPTNPLFASNVGSNHFYATGDAGSHFYWTTYGNTF